MEKDLKLAKKLLRDHDASCVYVKGDEIYISHERGVKPTLELIEKGINLNGFSVCDKVVGKAAAMLFVHVGVVKMHTLLISEVAMRFLNQAKIEYSFDEKCQNIINRTQTGMCPLEKATLELDDTNEALKKIKQTLEDLSKKK